MKFIILSVCIASIIISCKLENHRHVKLPIKIYYYFSIEDINNLERYALIKYHSIENKQLPIKIITNIFGEKKLKNSNEEIIYGIDKGLDNQWFTADDILSPVHKRAYNDRGDLIEENGWIKFGSNNDYILSKTRYHYDYAGKIFYQTEYIPGSNQIAFYYHFEYDERGITRQIQYDGYGDDKLWYTKDDLITENDFFCINHHYNAKGKLIRKTIYENAGIDKIFLTEDDVEEGNIFIKYKGNKKYVLSYKDSKGLMLEPVSKVNLTGYIEEVYDKTGSLLKAKKCISPGKDSKWFTSDDLFDSIVVYEYEKSSELVAKIPKKLQGSL